MLARLLLVWCIVLASVGVVSGQPFIFYRGILNAGSFAPAGTPNGSIARGSIFTIFGRDLGPVDGAQVAAFPLGATLQGVEIKVCRAGDCLSAIPLFVRADQINAIMLSNAPLGSVSIQVTFNGEAGNFSPATVVESSVGVFTVNGRGSGPGIVQNFNAPDDQPLNSLLRAARPGQVVTVWATGLGAALNADNVEPQVGDLPADVEIFVGGARVTNTLYSGRSAQFAGADQIIFEIPSDAPVGCWTPVFIRLNGKAVASAFTLAITPDGGPCAEPGNAAGEALRAGGRLARVSLIRSTRAIVVGGMKDEIVTDEASARFGEEEGGPWAFNPDVSDPPLGSCSVYQTRGASTQGMLPGSGPTVRGLDAGAALTIAVGQASTTVAGEGGRYEAVIGDRLGENAPLETLILDTSEEVVVRSAGGADVGAFEARVPAAPAIDWTNRDEMVTVDRDAGVTLRWNIAAFIDTIVLISGGARDAVSDSQTLFSCFAEPAAGEFIVPGYVLANVAPVRVRGSQSDGTLGLTALRPASELTADGVVAGVLSSWRWVGKSVEFR